MQLTDPSLVPALLAVGVGVLMVHAGVGKGLLAWKRNGTDGRRRKR
jgi:hypothetical protein